MSQRPATPADSIRDSQIEDITDQIVRIRAENLALNAQNQILADKFNKLAAYNQALGDDVANSDRQIYILEHQIDERQEMVEVVLAEINRLQREISKIRRILLKDRKFRGGVVELMQVQERTEELDARVKEARELIGETNTDSLELLREKVSVIEESNADLERQIGLLKVLLDGEAGDEVKRARLEDMMKQKDLETERLMDEIQEQQAKNAAEALKKKRTVSALRQSRDDVTSAKELFGDVSEWPELSEAGPTPSEVERREKEEQERREREEKERLEREEQERLERERLEQERLERERLEREEQERLEKERLEREEQERLEKERLEKEEQERLEKERLEREEQERLEKERLEKEEQERLAREAEERRRKRRKRRRKPEVKPKEPEQPFSDDEVDRDRINQQLLKERQRESEELLKSLRDALEKQEKERDELMDEIAKVSERKLVMKTLPDMTVVIKDTETDEDVLGKLRTKRDLSKTLAPGSGNTGTVVQPMSSTAPAAGIGSLSNTMGNTGEIGGGSWQGEGVNNGGSEQGTAGVSNGAGNWSNIPSNTFAGVQTLDDTLGSGGFMAANTWPFGFMDVSLVGSEVQTSITLEDIMKKEMIIEEQKKRAQEIAERQKKLDDMQQEILELEEQMDRVRSDTAKREEEIKRVKEEIELAKLKQELLKGLTKIKMDGMSKEEIEEVVKQLMRKKREEMTKVMLRSKTAEEKLAELMRYREVLDRDLYDMDHREKPEVKRLQSEVKVFGNRVTESRKSLEESIAQRDAKRQEYAEVKSQEALNTVLDLMVQRNKLERREAKWRSFAKESWDSIHALEDFSEANKPRRLQISEQLQKYERDLLLATNNLRDLNDYSDLLGALISEHTDNWKGK